MYIYALGRMRKREGASEICLQICMLFMSHHTRARIQIMQQVTKKKGRSRLQTNREHPDVHRCICTRVHNTCVDENECARARAFKNLCAYNVAFALSARCTMGTRRGS